MLPREVKVMSKSHGTDCNGYKASKACCNQHSRDEKTTCCGLLAMKKNLMHAVRTFENVEDSFGPVVRRLKVEHALLPRMIIFT